MSTGPLRRVIGTVGLVALAPIAVLLLQGGITPVDAAVRAVATLAVTVVVGRVAAWWLGHLAASFEDREAEEEEESPPPPPTPPPRRRGSDTGGRAQPH